MITAKDIKKKRVKTGDPIYYYDERGFKHISVVKDIIEFQNYIQVLIFGCRCGYRIVNVQESVYNSLEMKENK